jgi:anti-sigma factor RsiW
MEFDRSEDRSLWRRVDGPATGVAMPSALDLAAYAEGRLSEGEAEQIELWLAEHPEGIADVAAGRDAREVAEPAPEALFARAMALVREPSGATVVPFRRKPPAMGSWRAVVAWGGLAASILATSLVGFTLADGAYAMIASQQAGPDLLDPPSGLFSSLIEDEGA